MKELSGLDLAGPVKELLTSVWLCLLLAVAPMVVLVLYQFIPSAMGGLSPSVKAWLSISSVYGFVGLAIHGIQEYQRRKKAHQQNRALLQGVVETSDQEAAVLLSAFEAGSRSLVLPYSGTVSASLFAKKLILPSRTPGSLHKWTYTIPNAVYEHLEVLHYLVADDPDRTERIQDWMRAYESYREQPRWREDQW